MAREDEIRKSIEYMFECVRKGDVEGARECLNGYASPHDVDENGDTPLVIAARNKDREMATLLHCHGAYAEESIFTYMKKGRLDKVREMLEEGFDPNETDALGQNLMYWAVDRGDLVSMEILEEYGLSTPEKIPAA